MSPSLLPGPEPWLEASLRSYMQAYKDKGCGDPPEQSQELANKPLPAPDSGQTSSTVKAVAVAGGGLTAGYVAYRVVRMLPSVLIPPLWETAPVNALVP